MNMNTEEKVVAKDIAAGCILEAFAVSSQSPTLVAAPVERDWMNLASGTPIDAYAGMAKQCPLIEITASPTAPRTPRHGANGPVSFT